MTGPDYAWIFSDSIEAETIEGFDDPDVVDGLVGAGKIFAAAYIPGDPVAKNASVPGSQHREQRKKQP